LFTTFFRKLFFSLENFFTTTFLTVNIMQKGEKESSFYCEYLAARTKIWREFNEKVSGSLIRIFFFFHSA
jgi:predicted RecB family nuclease